MKSLEVISFLYLAICTTAGGISARDQPSNLASHVSQTRKLTTSCMATGCSGQVCSSEGVITTCEFRPEYACYRAGECGNFGQNGSCAWKDTPELRECLQSFDETETCLVTGCSSHVCASEDTITTCEWRPEYACYQEYGECGRFDPNGGCGWKNTAELTDCLDSVGEVEGCTVSGCSSEICHSEPLGSGCIWLPEFACYQEYGECGNFGSDGGCAWKNTTSLSSCLDSLGTD